MKTPRMISIRLFPPPDPCPHPACLPGSVHYVTTPLPTLATSLPTLATSLPGLAALLPGLAATLPGLAI